MNNNMFFKKMLELNQFFETSLNKFEILKERNKLEYQKYSLSITNVIKAKSIIESIYKKAEQHVLSNENKNLTENELIDTELPLLKVAMRFVISGKEKAKVKFEKVTEEYTRIDEERSILNDILLSIELLQDVHGHAKYKNQKRIEYISTDIDLMMEDQNALLDEKSIELTFSCDVLELICNLEQNTEGVIEDLDHEILIETIDL